MQMHNKGRTIPLPASLMLELKALLKEREGTHNADVVAVGEIQAFRDQYVFAADHVSKDPVAGQHGRHHIIDTTLQRAFAVARTKLRIKRHYTIHGLRHACAQFWERNGVPVSDIQKLLGHRDVDTTMRYLKSGLRGVPKVPSPV